MINRRTLDGIIDLAEGGRPLLTGEIKILRDAVALLDDLAGTLDKIIAGYDHDRGYDHETTAELRIIEQGGCDDHGGNRP